MFETKDSSVPDMVKHSKPNRFSRCATMEEHWLLVRKDPEYRWRRRQSEIEIKDWIKRYAGEGLRTGILRIPVVVHVIYNTPNQNIPDAQIHSQIEVLNADFRRLNADSASTPLHFAALAADARLEFALAVRDPDCHPTTGITRTPTSVSGWTFTSNGMKASLTGGHDPWNVTKYLNIWVVNCVGFIGRGTYPWAPARTQGVVCHYQAFGNIGDLLPRAALGRTATHEIGHFLNLLHIWGEDGSGCTGSDEVADTPNQDGPSPEEPPCRPILSSSCSGGPDMSMNFMDYSPDQCMNLFTFGQVARMDATLYTTRSSLIASDGLVPVTTGSTPDLWMKDNSDDYGAEPNTSAQPMYISEDIWVRKINDGLLNQDHQNPEYRPPGSASNYVYVRVRNRGCSGTLSGTLKLYWAKASSGLSWPAPWDGSVTTPALMGAVIDSQIVSVAAGDDEIVTFPWMPPNPLDYASFGADQSHFCLLARIETTSTPPFGMAFPETTNLYTNVQNNNNIIWKNITIVDDVPGYGRFTSVIAANFSDGIQMATLSFLAPKQEKPSIFEWGQVFIELPSDMLKKYTKDKYQNIQKVNDNVFQILKSEASLGTFLLDPLELYTIHIRFVPMHKKPLGSRIFTLDLVQTVKDQIIGGQRLILKNQPDNRHHRFEKSNTTFDGVSWVPCNDKMQDGYSCCR